MYLKNESSELLACLLVLGLIGMCLSQTDCPAPRIISDGICYEFIEEHKYYWAAAAHCEQLGGRLADISERSEVVHALWDIFGEQTEAFADDGFWVAGHATYGRVYDSRCEKPLSFVCQFDKKTSFQDCPGPFPQIPDAMMQRNGGEDLKYLETITYTCSDGEEIIGTCQGTLGFSLSTGFCGELEWFNSSELVSSTPSPLATAAEPSRDSDATNYTDLESVECKLTEQGTEYRGTVSQTRKGVPCLEWYSEYLLKERSPAQIDSNFIDGNRKNAKNYCRNPDGDPKGPWCYDVRKTGPTERAKWNYCDIPNCPEPPKPEVKSRTFDLSFFKKQLDEFRRRLDELQNLARELNLANIP
ncbi:unnamed protein product [Cyprideis torosa]|uniref:Uncharacterized protein n=1 Tax=Cyprideis torosa TaxID=163714 RepID=A0A7R8W4T4_9CRUS|nr:unnamed protein product [Cyprideis torosa]CAG0884514.1 unnamed protein product [Cyprideis torosa]